MKKIFRLFEYAYLGIMFFFIYQAFIEWKQEEGKTILYLCFALVAVFMFFFKRNFRRRIEENNKNR